MTAVEGERDTGSPVDDQAGPAAAPEPPPAAPEPPAPVPARWNRARLAALAALLVVVGAVVGGVVGAYAVLELRPPAPPSAAAAAPAEDLADVVGTVTPAVLRIQAGAPDTGTAGTAVVLTPTGDVVTNEHLVRGESTATLISPDGRSSTARVVATDP
jgi:putative serine protease PepD